MTAADRAMTADGLVTDPDALAAEMLRETFGSPTCPGALLDEADDAACRDFINRFIAMIGDEGFVIARREQLAPPAALVDSTTGEAITPETWIPRPVDPTLMSDHKLVEHFASLEERYDAMKAAWWRVMRPCKDEISRRLLDYKSPTRKKKEPQS